LSLKELKNISLIIKKCSKKDIPKVIIAGIILNNIPIFSVEKTKKIKPADFVESWQYIPSESTIYQSNETWDKLLCTEVKDNICNLVIKETFSSNTSGQDDSPEYTIIDANIKINRGNIFPCVMQAKSIRNFFKNGTIAIKGTTIVNIKK
jgi:hypothetical protein